MGATFFPYSPVPADQAAARAATVHRSDLTSHYWVPDATVVVKSPPTFQCNAGVDVGRLVVSGFAVSGFDYANVTPRFISDGFVFKTTAMNEANWRLATRHMAVAYCIGVYSLPYVIHGRAALDAPVKLPFPRMGDHIAAYRFRLFGSSSRTQGAFGVIDLVIATRGRTKALFINEVIAASPYPKYAPAGPLARSFDIKMLRILTSRMRA